MNFRYSKRVLYKFIWNCSSNTGKSTDLPYMKVIQRRTFSSERIPKTLITGGLGQLGVHLARKMRQLYGEENVILSDIVSASQAIRRNGKFLYADILDFKGLQKIIVDEDIKWLIHFSALLSGVAEQNTSLAMRVNIEGLHNIIELAKQYQLRLFVPSTIGAFGPDSPRDPTPDVCVQRPTTIYGVSKVHAELMGEYYHRRFALDFRCLRLPGVISSDSPPGGGTTDYAVHIFHEAVNKGEYNCYLSPDTKLPMIYIDDCISGIVQIMQEPEENLKRRVYNINAFSFTPHELCVEIQKHIPNFKIKYNIDFRQQIADSWPKIFDDSNARRDWNWKNETDLDGLVNIMLKNVKHQKAQKED